jgi:MYXO-CTERM domain-containing protein
MPGGSTPMETNTNNDTYSNSGGCAVAGGGSERLAHGVLFVLALPWLLRRRRGA